MGVARRDCGLITRSDALIRGRRPGTRSSVELAAENERPYQRTVLILRRVLAVLLFVAASFTLGVPATASIMHETDHMGSPVSAGQYHHHASDGTVELEQDAADEKNDESGKPGTGHSHAPAAAADPAMFASVALALPLIASRVPQYRFVHQLHTRSWSPHRRPPRTV